MAQVEASIPAIRAAAGEHRAAALLRTVVMGLISFLTFVDLFAAQAILPTLVEVYQVTPAAMGFAVNASTIGMAAAGIGITFVSGRINRRQGIWISLACLSVPTFLLAAAPDLMTFTLLRIAQGLFMSAAGFRGVGIPDSIADARHTAAAAAAFVRQ